MNASYFIKYAGLENQISCFSEHAQSFKEESLNWFFLAKPEVKTEESPRKSWNTTYENMRLKAASILGNDNRGSMDYGSPTSSSGSSSPAEERRPSNGIRSFSNNLYFSWRS